MKTKRELILATVRDLVNEFLHDGRKEDEELPRGAIEEALKKGEIARWEIVNEFERALIEGLEE